MTLIVVVVFVSVIIGIMIGLYFGYRHSEKIAETKQAQMARKPFVKVVYQHLSRRNNELYYYMGYEYILPRAGSVLEHFISKPPDYKEKSVLALTVERVEKERRNDGLEVWLIRVNSQTDLHDTLCHENWHYEISVLTSETA